MFTYKVSKERTAHRFAVECMADAIRDDDGRRRFDWVVVVEVDGYWMFRAFEDGVAASRMVNEHAAVSRYTNLYTAAEVRMFITEPSDWTDSEVMS